jgi:hypothetical protein
VSSEAIISAIADAGALEAFTARFIFTPRFEVELTLVVFLVGRADDFLTAGFALDDFSLFSRATCSGGLGSLEGFKGAPNETESGKLGAVAAKETTGASPAAISIPNTEDKSSSPKGAPAPSGMPNGTRVTAFSASATSS